jgi:hypothetical protein
MLMYINLPDAVKMKMSLKSHELISKMDFNYMGNELLRTINAFAGTYKKPSPVAMAAINLWYGRYNTIEWGKV